MPETDVRLLPGWMEDDDRYVAAVSIELPSGWKTYWRTAGEGGIAPVFDWTGSTNIAEAELIWPTPTVFDAWGMRSFGYEGGVVIPVRFELIDPDRDARADLQLEFGVCEDICIAAEATTTANLPVGESHNAILIETMLADGPRDARQHGLSIANCVVDPGEDGSDVRVTADLLFAEDVSEVPVIVLDSTDSGLWFGETVAAQQNARLFSAVAPVVPLSSGPLFIERGSLRFSVITASGVLEHYGC
ncbi:MAG: protein-disulfide reductase DsbD domain-containing protein [Rubricella sp.]